METCAALPREIRCWLSDISAKLGELHVQWAVAGGVGVGTSQIAETQVQKPEHGPYSLVESGMRRQSC